MSVSLLTDLDHSPESSLHPPCPTTAYDSRELQVHSFQASGMKFRDQANYKEQDPLKAPPSCDRRDGAALASAGANALSGRGARQWCSCPREPPASAGRKKPPSAKDAPLPLGAHRMAGKEQTHPCLALARGPAPAPSPNVTGCDEETSVLCPFLLLKGSHGPQGAHTTLCPRGRLLWSFPSWKSLCLSLQQTMPSCGSYCFPG